MQPEPRVDPSVYRRRLRNILRQTRESLGIVQATAAQQMSWSVSKLIRIETGSVTISVNDLKALLAYYGINDAERVNSLIEMAKNSRRNSWLAEYRGVASDVFLTFLGYEEAAVRSYNFQPTLVPGLLQTDEYSMEVLQAMRGPKDPRRIEKLIDLRIARRERVFSRTGAIRLSYLLDESIVHRIVGGPGVMKRQLSHLLESVRRDSMSIRILPYKMGIYRSMRVPFIVMEFS